MAFPGQVVGLIVRHVACGKAGVKWSLHVTCPGPLKETLLFPSSFSNKRCFPLPPTSVPNTTAFSVFHGWRCLRSSWGKRLAGMSSSKSPRLWSQPTCIVTDSFLPSHLYGRHSYFPPSPNCNSRIIFLSLGNCSPSSLSVLTNKIPCVQMISSRYHLPELPKKT